MDFIFFFFLFFSISHSANSDSSAAKDFVVTAQDQAIIDATNREREKRSLKTLTVNAKLMQAAKLQANNMAQANHLSHELLQFRGLSTLAERLKYVEYKWRSAGENIAWNYSLANVVKGWMISPGHRRNIMGDYAEIGVGIGVNTKGEFYYCQVFGKPGR